MNAVTLLTEDHRSFELLFDRYLAARSPRLREDLARRLLHEAQLHISLEEKYVYPIAQERSGAHLDEHSAAKLSLAELAKMEVEDRAFAPKLKAFVEELMIHSHEEERLFFPALRRAMGRSELEALGRLIQNAREVRPDEPVVGGLAERAISYVLASWRAQLDNVCERVSAKVLRTSHP